MLPFSYVQVNEIKGIFTDFASGFYCFVVQCGY